MRTAPERIACAIVTFQAVLAMLPVVLWFLSLALATGLLPLSDGIQEPIRAYAAFGYFILLLYGPFAALTVNLAVLYCKAAARNVIIGFEALFFLVNAGFLIAAVFVSDNRLDPADWTLVAIWTLLGLGLPAAMVALTIISRDHFNAQNRHRSTNSGQEQPNGKRP